MYIKVKYKFIFALFITFLYFILICFIMSPWIIDLSALISFPLAILVIGGIAIVPGLLNTFLVIAAMFDTQKNIQEYEAEEEDITILIAAYNEESAIYETIQSIAAQKYKGHITVLAIDNNSKDNTAQEIKRAIRDFSSPLLDVYYIFEEKQGKFNALNNGLARTKTKNVITLDADTYMYKDSLQNIVARQQKEKCAAVAGATMVRNSRENLLARMQEWDYFLSIASVKKMQGLFQGTLVAQGAFSIYNTEIVRNCGGWYDCIGEDIVLTWNMLAAGHKVYYEPKAVVFTIVPTNLKILFTQRRRWARGKVV